MDNPSVTVTYKLANGERIAIEVSIPVRELLEQSDRQIRSQRRQDRRYLDFVDFIDGLADAAMTNPEPDPADLLIRMERYGQLYAAVGKLSEVQRKRLMLYFTKKLTHQKIADMEGVNRATVSRSIERALEQLKKHLTE